MEASEYAFVDLAVDQPTSLVYWTNRKTRKVWQCDLEGQNRRVVNPSGPDILTQGFTVQDSTMFWREKSSGSATAVYRFDVRKAAKLQVYNGDSIEDLEILTGRLSPDFSIPNPCANNSCSHICVPSSSNKEYTCLCPDNYALERDGKNCNLGNYFHKSAPLTPKMNNMLSKHNRIQIENNVNMLINYVTKFSRLQSNAISWSLRRKTGSGRFQCFMAMLRSQGLW